MHCSSGCGSGCSTGVSCPCPEQGNPKINSLEMLVNCYWQNHQQIAVEQCWYGGLESLEHAVTEAAVALADENVSLDHVPDRIPLSVLAIAKQRLVDALPRFKKAENFEEILTIVENSLSGLQGVEEEMVYLTSLRIGMQKGCEPQSIHLMEEVRLGAGALVRIEGNTKELKREQLPRIFQHPDLPLEVIQGCLAICRHQLIWLKQAGQLP